MVRSSLITDGSCWYDQAANRNIAIQNTATTAGYEIPAATGNDLFQNATSQRGANAWVDRREPLPLKLDFVDMAVSICPTVCGDDFGFPLFVEVFKHFTEKSDYAMLRDIGYCGDLFIGFDDGLASCVEFENGVIL
jgi:hypothetical protein